MPDAVTVARQDSHMVQGGCNAVQSAGQTRLTFEPLDAPFGVVVRGVEWSDGPPDPQVVAELTRAMRRHLLLVFRGQTSPSHDQANAFWRGFGPLVMDTVDGQFHYNRFSTEKAVNNVMRSKEGGNLVVAGEDGMVELGWHQDQSHKPQFKTISQLENVRFGPGAVPTAFRDMYTVCELLPKEVKARLEGKQGIFLDPRLPGPDKLPRLCDAMHPVLASHPESGRKAVFGSDWTTYRIAGMSAEESAAMLAFLRDFALENAPYYEHYWEEGDICAWDNFGVQHRRDDQPPGVERIMRLFEGVTEG
ncbi:MAG: TauD/TfdA family dioxygenase [Novosphingobium sp.]|nr:TauD/TfdA family dioxygenase [Novosphingobium sp.]